MSIVRLGIGLMIRMRREMVIADTITTCTFMVSPCERERGHGGDCLVRK